ncbi:hypothetical protein AKO1_003464 [Acrasis kona]|uniref:PB1 domain-containing protein n=1 Tax=Acrasis kona TaxID=1008807 RepID=A0AAW2Z7H7_9EUKA
MEEETAVVEVKASLSGMNQIRRFKYKSTSFAFTTLYKTIQEIFSKSYGTFTVQYKDKDDDFITISTDDEFSYAVELLFRSNSDTLRLYLVQDDKDLDEEESDEDSDIVYNSEVPFTDILPSCIIRDIDFKVQKFRSKLMQKELKNYSKQQQKMQKQQIKKNKKTTPTVDSPAVVTTPTEPVFKPLPPQPVQQTNNNQPSRKLMARFVAHITIPDHTVLQPNTNFIKTWRFRNDSDIMWNPGCRLLFIGKQRGGDDQMNGPDGVVVNKEVHPGEEVDISVSLRSPSKSGRYVGYWRMCEGTAPAKKFGQRVWVSVLVQ